MSDYQHKAGLPRTCASTVAVGTEARDIDAVKVVGGESRVGEKEKSDEGLKTHLVGGVEELGCGVPVS